MNKLEKLVMSGLALLAVGSIALSVYARSNDLKGPCMEFSQDQKGKYFIETEYIDLDCDGEVDQRYMRIYDRSMD